MKVGSVMAFLFFMVTGLVILFSPTKERLIIRRAAAEIVNVIRTRATVLWDRLNGVGTYELKEPPAEDAFDDGQEGEEWLDSGVS